MWGSCRGHWISTACSGGYSGHPVSSLGFWGFFCQSSLILKTKHRRAGRLLTRSVIRATVHDRRCFSFSVNLPRLFFVSLPFFTLYQQLQNCCHRGEKNKQMNE